MPMHRIGISTVLMAAIVVAITPPHAMATNIKDPDWKVNLTTEVQKGVLNFRGSKCKDPVKVFVNYMDNTDKGDKKPKSYEEFWYNQAGKPLGQEKFDKYGIRPDEQVVMEIKHKNKDQVQREEYKAAANAAIRFFLDCKVHKGAINTLMVPVNSFDGIVQSIEEQGFTKFEPASADDSTPSGNKPFLLVQAVDDTTASDKSQYLEYQR
ncbi:MAG TPA: hypothetical protein V6C76_12925 [Drouetiella sp.]